MQKRGEKSLSMIFGLFMLLIISLVVLAMFFKFVKKGGQGLNDVGSKYAQEAAIEEARQTCKELCSQITNEDGIIKFCSKMFAVDWNDDGLIEGHASEGRWWFCEQKIPCFILESNCKDGRYDGNKCRQILAEYRTDLYENFYNDVEQLSPDVDSNGVIDASEQSVAIKDGCNLPNSMSNLNDPENPLPPTLYNWKERFCFYKPFSDAKSPTCPIPTLTP